MEPKVSIILLNWNGLFDTQECLDSLLKIEYKNYEIILVDNNSQANDVKVLQKDYGDRIKKIIVNDDNLGFATGNNVGIKFAMTSNPDYILLLNNDTIVETDFLTKLIDKENTSSSIGILTPKICFNTQRDIIWSAGGYISKLRATGVPTGYGKPEHKYSEDKYCSFASGCCMLIKSEVIKKVGMLDQNYFLYIEDTEYCQRVIDAQYKILYVGSSRIYHKVNATTSRDNDLLPIYYSLRNRLYFAKNNSGWIYYLAFTYIFFVFAVKWVFVFKDKRSAAGVIKKSFSDFLSGRMGRTDYFGK